MQKPSLRSPSIIAKDLTTTLDRMMIPDKMIRARNLWLSLLHVKSPRAFVHVSGVPLSRNEHPGLAVTAQPIDGTSVRDKQTNGQPVMHHRVVTANGQGRTLSDSPWQGVRQTRMISAYLFGSSLRKSSHPRSKHTIFTINLPSLSLRCFGVAFVTEDLACLP